MGGQFKEIHRSVLSDSTALLLKEMTYDLELDNGDDLRVQISSHGRQYDDFLPVTATRASGTGNRIFSFAPILEKRSSSGITSIHPVQDLQEHSTV